MGKIARQNRVELRDEIKARECQMARAFFVPLEDEVRSDQGVLVRFPRPTELLVHAIAVVRFWLAIQDTESTEQVVSFVTSMRVEQREAVAVRREETVKNEPLPKLKRRVRLVIPGELAEQIDDSAMEQFGATLIQTGERCLDVGHRERRHVVRGDLRVPLRPRGGIHEGARARRLHEIMPRGRIHGLGDLVSIFQPYLFPVLRVVPKVWEAEMGRLANGIGFTQEATGFLDTLQYGVSLVEQIVQTERRNQLGHGILPPPWV